MVINQYLLRCYYVLCNPMTNLIFYTYVNMTDVSEPDILHRRFDVGQVSNINFNHCGNVHSFHQHIQDYVWHYQLKSQSTDLSLDIRYWDIRTLGSGSDRTVPPL